MGFIRNMVDVYLLVFFLVIAIAAPLLDAQSCLPPFFFPQCLLDLQDWYQKEYGDYLTLEKPHFFVGLVYLELVFQWPLAVFNIYGLLTGKSWLKTTCIMYGSSTLTSMVAILCEMIMSGRSCHKLLGMYLPFLVLSLLSILRGLIPSLLETSPIASTTKTTKEA